MPLKAPVMIGPKTGEAYKAIEANSGERCAGFKPIDLYLK